MNNNSIYGDGTVTIRGSAATSASVSLGVDTGLSAGYGGGVAYYDTRGGYYYQQQQCRICGHTTMQYSYTSMVTVCGMCGYRQDDFSRANNSELSAREALNKLTDAMKQPGKVEPVEEDKIKEQTMDFSDIKIGGKYKLTEEGIDVGCYGTSRADFSYIIVNNILTDNSNEKYLKYTGYDSKGKQQTNCEMCLRPSHLIAINSQESKTMLQPLSDLSNLIQRSFNKETKTLYRAGYLTKDLSITSKLTDAVGEMFVGHIIEGDVEKVTFDVLAKELIKRANEEIEEAEKSEKK